MFTGEEVVRTLTQLGVTHVVAVPDSTLGLWEDALRASVDLELIRVCREGEAWGVAAGLYLGGAAPVVMIQCTGMFESGDALRNVLYDYRMPLFAIVGYRSYLSQESMPGDTATKFTEPILRAWGIDYRLIDKPDNKRLLAEHYQACRSAEKPGVVLIAEGRV